MQEPRKCVRGNKIKVALPCFYFLRKYIVHNDTPNQQIGKQDSYSSASSTVGVILVTNSNNNVGVELDVKSIIRKYIILDFKKSCTCTKQEKLNKTSKSTEVGTRNATVRSSLVSQNEQYHTYTVSKLYSVML